MEELKHFSREVKDFTSLPSSLLIDYFALYLELRQGIEFWTALDITKCFKTLKLQEYSNISSYLSLNSKRGRKVKYLKTKDGYHLESNYKSELLGTLGHPIEQTLSTNLFDITLLDGTRKYLVAFGKQGILCYDNGAYDACFVMLRKLIEIIIIELFERYNIEVNIKNISGDFYFLSDLIDKVLAEKAWNLGRNTKQALPKIKKLGDMSAHARRFVAKKSDVDSLKDDLRIIIQELIILIDYQNWHKK